MSHILELRNLSFIYGKGTPFEKKAVDDVSLTIEKGEFIGIIGHTGSGKSTFLRCLNLLEETVAESGLEVNPKLPFLSEL